MTHTHEPPEFPGRFTFDRSVDICVTRVRKKIEPDPERPRFIKTVRGVGYRFVPDGE